MSRYNYIESSNKTQNFRKPTEKKSFGLACCRFNTKKQNMEILLIQKRCSYYYAEFILGHYTKTDDRKIIYLMNNMTIDEKLCILSFDFGNMWYKLCLINPEMPTSKIAPDEYERYARCKRKFEQGFMPNKERLRNLIDRSRCNNTVWEIPKGRKSNPQEKDLNCAIREFREETGIDETLYELLPDDIRVMTYFSSNIKYVNYYYISYIHVNDGDTYNKVAKSLMNEDDQLKLNFKNNNQISEVVAARWFSLNDIKLLHHGKELYTFIKPIFKILTQKYKIHKLSNLKLM